MTTELAQVHNLPVVTPDQADTTTQLWPRLLTSPILTETEAMEISTQVEALTRPATKAWIAGRVAVTLTRYFASSVPEPVMRATADDWFEELKCYPSWALLKAFRWWTSDQNPERKRKPLEGDIAARTKVELGVVKVAEMALKRYSEGRGVYVVPDPSERKPIDRKAAAEIMAQLPQHMQPKKFGEAE